ncbi:MAG: hypothetical protein ABIR56_14150, partial [Polaromonas sp.]
MGFFKPSPGPVARKVVAGLDALIWILIYGGLLTLILGFYVDPMDDDTGWPLMLGGGLAAV